MNSDTKFKINLKEGLFELEGNESFVDKHLEKFEEIFKIALKEVILNNKDILVDSSNSNPALVEEIPSNEEMDGKNTDGNNILMSAKYGNLKGGKNEIYQTQLPINVKPAKHTIQNKVSINIPLLPVDLKSNSEKIGLREFYHEKKPRNHYEKCTLFVYYITKFNKQTDVRYGEILSCYEEINEKKPSVIDIVKNSIRYKGWLELGNEKYSARLTISGENFIKFDLPKT